LRLRAKLAARSRLNFDDDELFVRIPCAAVTALQQTRERGGRVARACARNTITDI
jgi:hypothetical protein